MIGENVKLGLVKNDAVIRFQMDVYNKFGDIVPDTQIKFEKVIKSLQGHIFFIDKELNGRVYLKYPDSMRFETPAGKQVDGIDLHKDLVIVFESVGGINE